MSNISIPNAGTFRQQMTKKRAQAKAVAIDFRFPFVIATTFVGVIAATLSTISIAAGVGA